MIARILIACLTCVSCGTATSTTLASWQGAPSQLPVATFTLKSRDCNGDGIPDFVIGSTYWPASKPPGRRGRVVLFSGKTFQPLVKIDGAKDGEDVGSAACIVGDVDGDGMGDIAYTARRCKLGGGRFQITIASGKTGATIRDIECDLHYDTSQIELACDPAHKKDKLCDLMVSYPFTSSAIRCISLGDDQTMWEANGRALYDNFGYLLTFVCTNEEESQLLVASTSRGTHVSWVVAGARKAGDATAALRIFEGKREIAQCVTPSTTLPDTAFWSCTTRAVYMTAEDKTPVIFGGIPTKQSGDEGVNRVVGYEVLTGKQIDELIVQTGDSEWGASIAANVDAHGVLRSLVVGAPEADAGRGRAWLYPYPKKGAPIEIIPPEGFEEVGRQLIEIGDVNGDGITDWVMVGYMLWCDAEHAFEVRSGADGAIITAYSPPKTPHK